MKNDKVRSRLRHLYEGSFASRKRHYDDGGSVYYDSSGSWYNNNASNPTPPVDTLDTSNFYTPTQDQSTQNLDIANQMGMNNLSSDLSPAGGSGSSGSGILSALGSALGVSNIGQFVQKYGALAPLLSSMLGSNKPASAPATPSGYGAIPSIATPTNPRTYSTPNVQNWYTYGQGPEQSFFQNNQLPTVPGVSPTAAPASGSMNTQPITGPQPVMRGRGGPAFDSQQGDSYVPDPGHGDGTSDDIDARLSGGEYVMDATTTSLAGKGSNEAGARALDALRKRIWQHAGKDLSKGKQPMKTKPLHKYLPKGAPGAG